MTNKRCNCFLSISYKTIALSVLCTISSFQAVRLTTMHLHVLEDGRIVVHSHTLPNSESKDNHKHTDQDYQHFAAIGKLIINAIVTQTVTIEVKDNPFTQNSPYRSSICHDYHHSVQTGRSPPSFIC